MLCPSCPSATTLKWKAHPPGSFPSHTLPITTARDQSPAQWDCFQEHFQVAKWEEISRADTRRLLQQHWCKSEAESHMQAKACQPAGGCCSKFPRIPVVEMQLCHNLWAFVLRLEVHMPTSGPRRQGSPSISPLKQKIHFSIGRKSPSCHSTPLKQFTRKLLAESTRANEAAACAYKMRLSETPWAFPQPCQPLQGAAPEDTNLKHILELSLLWSAHWGQALLSPGPAEAQIRMSSAAVGSWEPGKERVYFLLVIQKDPAFHCVLLSLMREGTTTGKLLLSWPPFD